MESNHEITNTDERPQVTLRFADGLHITLGEMTTEEINAMFEDDEQDIGECYQISSKTDDGIIPGAMAFIGSDITGEDNGQYSPYLIPGAMAYIGSDIIGEENIL